MVCLRVLCMRYVSLNACYIDFVMIFWRRLILGGKLSFPPRIYFPPECTLTFFLHALLLCVCIVYYGVLACIVLC